ncbi:unnamed protein product [Lactuca virosa]|uniref:Uncharacterized protein n=1 Tax=Lactuca virosa TaxID=75947 RepID=A0AAU9PFU1_9ASTR|nr:unnamed protein product [Lactuca virosa]
MFKIHHPCWWSIILHAMTTNDLQPLVDIPEGPIPTFLYMTPYKMRVASESKFPHRIIILSVILEKLDIDSTYIRSYHKCIYRIIVSPKKGKKKSNNALKKMMKKLKKSKPDPTPSVYSQDASHVCVQSSSPAPDSWTSNQSEQTGPSNCATMVDSFSNHDDEQEGEKQTPQTLSTQDDQDKNIPMQTVAIPPSEGLIVDDEPTNMSIILHSKVSFRAFNIDLDNYYPSPHKESHENDSENDV